MSREKTIKRFEELLTGGYEHWVIHKLWKPPADSDPEGSKGELALVMFLMGADYDPVRIEFQPEGDVSIFADGHEWHLFSPNQLRMIADKAEVAAAMWEEIMGSDDAEKAFQVQ